MEVTNSKHAYMLLINTKEDNILQDTKILQQQTGKQVLIYGN